MDSSNQPETPPELKLEKTFWASNRVKIAIITIVIIAALFAVALVVLLYRRHTGKTASPSAQGTVQPFAAGRGTSSDSGDRGRDRFASKSPAEQAGEQLSGGHCTGTGPVKLSASPMKAEDFKYLIPYGLMTGAHVTPIDHQYFSLAYNSPRDAYEVRAPGDGHIVDIEHRTQPLGNSGNGLPTDEYRIVIDYTCTFLSYFDLITSLTPEIQSQFDQNAHGGMSAGVDIPVKAGQVIGHIGHQTLDYAVWDTEKPLTGFLVPAHYQTEGWKMYTADPFNYYTDDVKALLLSRDPRLAEPRAGKIDNDQAGKLVGNWFWAGTNGYEGDRSAPTGYWGSHLVIAPDLYQPTNYVASLGSFGSLGNAKQFALKGNAPDPATVDLTKGLVKYDLVGFNYVTADGSLWDQQDYTPNPQFKAQSQIQGCLLAQMTGQRTMKAENFAGKSCDGVSGFDSSAHDYER